MDMPMKPPMDEKKDEKESYFSCPACGAKLCAEKMDEPMDKPMDKPMGAPKPPVPGERADKMPMDKLKNVLMSAKPKPEPQGY